MRDGIIEILPVTEVDSPFTDKIRVYVYDNFYCPDIHVEHDSDAARYERWDLLADDKDFQQLVIDTLINHNKLGLGPAGNLHNYSMCRAEMGAQSSGVAVMECIFQDGKDITAEWAEGHGARSRYKAENEDCRTKCLERYGRAETRDQQEHAVFVALKKNWGNNYDTVVPLVVQAHIEAMSRDDLEQEYKKRLGRHPSGDDVIGWARDYIRYTDDLEELLHSIKGIKEKT